MDVACKMDALGFFLFRLQEVLCERLKFKNQEHTAAPAWPYKTRHGRLKSSEGKMAFPGPLLGQKKDSVIRLGFSPFFIKIKKEAWQSAD